jgi:hypothetical protein
LIRNVLKTAWRAGRTVLLAVAIVLAASMFWQLVPLEMAVWVGGEAFLYLEALVSVWVFARVAQVRAALPVLKARLRRVAGRLRPRRPRSRRAPAPLRVDEPDDPEPAAFPQAWPLAA